MPAPAALQPSASRPLLAQPAWQALLPPLRLGQGRLRPRVLLQRPPQPLQAALLWDQRWQLLQQALPR